MQTPISSRPYRSAVGLALAAALILVWLSLGAAMERAGGNPGAEDREEA